MKKELPKAIDIAKAIAAALGGSWTAKRWRNEMPEDRGAVHANLVERDAPDALSLDLYVNTFKGCLNVSLSPLVTGNKWLSAKDSVPYEERDDVPDININPERPVAALAADLNRRMIPRARVVWGYMLAKRTSDALAVAEADKYEKLLCEAWQARRSPHHGQADSTSRTLYPATLSGISYVRELRLDGNSVRIELTTTPELAAAIGRLMLAGVEKSA